MAKYTQEAHLLSLTTPLGKDVLLLHAFFGQEEISRLFNFHLDTLSEKSDIAPKDLVGKMVTWTVQPQEEEKRYFCGMVTQLVAGPMQIRKLREYRLEVKPWLWFLTQTADCRIFQNKTTPEIIETIFKDLGFTAFEKSLQGTYKKRDYCVQYRETDFQFVSRLMEEEGIFYWFNHENGKHTLVLADKKTAHKDVAQSEVEYLAGSLTPLHVTRWDHGYEFHSGKMAHTDYNFEMPTTSLMNQVATVLPLADTKKFEVYDYPGLYLQKGDGEGLAKIRMEEEETAYEIIQGASNCPFFSSGGQFKLKKHEIASEAGQKYVLTTLKHQATDPNYLTNSDKGPSYSNSFTCIPAAVQFRPARTTPKPVVKGPQTAVVVGPKGEEIYTDKYGRVKVQFFWDREGKKDENSSCWVRVSQGWAGKTWGIVFLPRIGQEVIVDFLEGDPDRPIITGRVYNAEQMPPYELPKNQTQSGVKTRSSKNGTTEKFNELRFEDKDGSEDIYFHAQKDFHRVVENDDDLKVGHDQTIEIKNNCTIVIKEGNREVTIEKGNDTLTIKKGNRTVSIDKGNDALTIKTGNQTTKVDAGKSELEAGTSIELKVGSNSILIDQKGVTIKGGVISIEGTSQATLKSPTTNVNGDGVLNLKGGVVNIN